MAQPVVAWKRLILFKRMTAKELGYIRIRAGLSYQDFEAVAFAMAGRTPEQVITFEVVKLPGAAVPGPMSTPIDDQTDFGALCHQQACVIHATIQNPDPASSTDDDEFEAPPNCGSSSED